MASIARMGATRALQPIRPQARVLTQQKRYYVYNKNESLERRNSSSNYSSAAKHGQEGNTVERTTVENAPSSMPKAPPNSRPTHMFLIGGAVLGLGYSFPTLLSSPHKVVSGGDTIHLAHPSNGP